MLTRNVTNYDLHHSERYKDLVVYSNVDVGDMIGSMEQTKKLHGVVAWLLVGRL